MKIIFFGASELGFECCKSIIDAGHNVIQIFTLPEKFEIKYKNEEKKSKVKNVLFKDFEFFNKAYGIDVITITGKISDYSELITKLQADLILVIGWYYMIPDSILNLPPKGTIGIHASLLPKYRGNAPLVWAMINGEKETGVSLFYIGQGVDEGDIIDQRKFQILESDNIKHVLNKAKRLSIKMLLSEIPKIADNSAQRIKQDHTLATIYPKRTPEDGLINWNLDIKSIKNFIKAQSKPYPGAFTIVNDKKVIIWDADVESVLNVNENIV